MRKIHHITNDTPTNRDLGGPSYIRPNQSVLYPKKIRDRILQKEVDDVQQKLLSYLRNDHRIPSNAPILKQLCTDIRQLFQENNNRQLSYLEQYRLKKDMKLLHSIQRKLKKAKCLIRVTDKSGVFYIGTKLEYERKAEQYYLETNAYQELPSNPLEESFYRVVRLLNDLRTSKHILESQYTKMMPNKNKIRLPHQYFNPKTHKVSTILFSSCYLDFVFFPIGRYTTTADYLLHSCTDHIHLNNARSTDSTSV